MNYANVYQNPTVLSLLKTFFSIDVFEKYAQFVDYLLSNFFSLLLLIGT